MAINLVELAKELRGKPLDERAELLSSLVAYVFTNDVELNNFKTILEKVSYKTDYKDIKYQAMTESEFKRWEKTKQKPANKINPGDLVFLGNKKSGAWVIVNHVYYDTNAKGDKFLKVSGNIKAYPKDYIFLEKLNASKRLHIPFTHEYSFKYRDLVCTGGTDNIIPTKACSQKMVVYKEG